MKPLFCTTKHTNKTIDQEESECAWHLHDECQIEWRPLLVRAFQDCPFLTGDTGSDEEGVPVVSHSQTPFNRLLARTSLLLGLQVDPYEKGRLLSKSK